MTRADFHVHTVFCDGKNTAEEMALAAVEKGLTALGFSAHSHTDIDESYCLRDVSGYMAEIARLKEAYQDKIAIYCGIEQDYQTRESTEGYDYAIGSVHYFLKDGQLRNVDLSAEDLAQTVNELFHGDWYAMAEHYFADVADLPNRHRIDFVGHFDLITKFNEGGRLFDESHPRYLTAAFDALDSLIDKGLPFEVNTGAISRGYRKTPYPAPVFLERIKEKGGRVLLSGDAHSVSGLCCQFDSVLPMLRNMGLEIISPTQLLR